MLPRWENSEPVLHAEHGTGNWIGAASALIHGDYIYLAYGTRSTRTRQPRLCSPLTDREWHPF